MDSLSKRPDVSFIFGESVAYLCVSIVSGVYYMRYKFVKTIISASILSSLSIGCFSSALAARTNYYSGWYSEEEHFFFFDEDNDRIYGLDEVVYRGFLGLSERTNQIDAAVAKNSADIQSKTLVGENSDGTLTRADGAGKTISVNDGVG